MAKKKKLEIVDVNAPPVGFPVPWEDTPSGPPSWSGKTWALIQGDAFGELERPELDAQIARLLKRAPSGARVHVISDPPYGSATHEGMVRYKAGQKSKAAAWKVEAVGFDPIQPLELVPKLLALPSVSGWIVCFGEIEALGDYKRAAGKRWRRAGIAPRIHPQPQMTGDRPAVAADGLAIIWGGKGRSIWSKGGHAATWDLATCRDPDRFHQTQKPLSIMTDLILDFTRPGDVILDPFAGSATTGVAALGVGRVFVGVELDPSYAERAAGRLHLQAERMAGVEGGAPDAGRHAKQAPLLGD